MSLFITQISLGIVMSTPSVDEYIYRLFRCMVTFEVYMFTLMIYVSCRGLV